MPPLALGMPTPQAPTDSRFFAFPSTSPFAPDDSRLEAERRLPDPLPWSSRKLGGAVVVGHRGNMADIREQRCKFALPGIGNCITEQCGRPLIGQVSPVRLISLG